MTLTTEQKTFKLLIDVTQEDIDLGQPCQTRHCAVARSLQRTLKPEGITKDGSAMVIGDWLRVYGDPKAMYGNTPLAKTETPDTICQLIRVFDDPMTRKNTLPERFITEWPLTARHLFKDEYVIAPDPQSPSASPDATTPAE